MPQVDRRGKYSWPPTKFDSVVLMTDKKTYGADETVKANLSLRIVGGLREAFHPDVWTRAYEDFDKIVRLTLRTSVHAGAGPLGKKIWETKKAVRKASFYWSRDPDLPYRIWAMIVPEDGGPPQIPTSVEDAKTRFLDVNQPFTLSASLLGPGRHRLRGKVSAQWGRRSFIEKGIIKSDSREAIVEVE